MWSDYGIEKKVLCDFKDNVEVDNIVSNAIQDAESINSRI